MNRKILPVRAQTTDYIRLAAAKRQGEVVLALQVSDY
jgi:hypothetical protein